MHRQRRRHLLQRAAQRRRSRCSPTDPDTRNSDGNVLNEFIYTPGQIQTATINVTGVLNKSINLTPFNVDPLGDIDTLFDANGYDDIIFGGLGNDFLHGGSGDDAMSGAEALPTSYVQLYSNNTTCGQENNDCVIGLVRLDYGHPFNLGDVLRFGADTNPWHFERHVAAASASSLLYDEYDPRRAILFHPNGTVVELPATTQGGHTCSDLGGPAPTSRQFFLNFVEQRGPGDPRLRRDFAERRHLPRRRARATATATTCSSATSATTGSSAAPATTRSTAATATT